MDVVDATRRAGQATPARRRRPRGGSVGATWRRVRRATTAQGAGESGLAKVIELHAVSAAGDALVLLALANTVFFSVPVGEARGRVALYLLVTMLPFSILAPDPGPAAGPLPARAPLRAGGHLRLAGVPRPG